MELWTKAAELGSIRAHYEVAREYFFGKVVEQDKDKGIQHYKLAAIGGHEGAHHTLGLLELIQGNIDLAMKHFIIAARRPAMTKDDYAKTLRAYQFSVDEMKSEGRMRSKQELRSEGIERLT